MYKLWSTRIFVVRNVVRGRYTQRLNDAAILGRFHWTQSPNVVHCPRYLCSGCSKDSAISFSPQERRFCNSFRHPFSPRQFSRGPAAALATPPDAASIRKIHLSSERRAHPIFGILIRNSLKFISPLIGRYFRRKWLNLSPEQREERYKWLRRNWPYLGAAALLITGVYVGNHLERTPLTNRLRFVTLTKRQYEQISDLGFTQTAVSEHKYVLPERDGRVRRVQRVAGRLRRANGGLLDRDAHRVWRVFVVDKPLQNAFVLPSGAIFVFTGLLDSVDNDDQLGLLLAHEMAHAVLNHGVEKLSLMGFLDWFIIAGLATIWAVVPSAFFSIGTSALYNITLKAMLSWPYDRKLENEADAVGLQIAAKACFDVREAIHFWNRMEIKKNETEEVQLPDFLSTHPSHGERAKRIENALPQAFQTMDQCNCPPLKPVRPRRISPPVTVY